ncbi:hypothetical protein [Streptomyces longisporoflavus]|uniref:Phosphatidate cytidylyltransferase n=1 Tax=Streptomyces longisporoflavus TaxID=28044 RepID=A0ABW7QZQ9_9ACTN
MAASWGPDRGVRRTMYVLAAAAVLLIALGAALDVLWLLGIGVWALMASFAIEFFVRP